MQIVIEIPDNCTTQAKILDYMDSDEGQRDLLDQLYYNPRLPKCHGRLIDVNTLACELKHFCEVICSDNSMTIIEADIKGQNDIPIEYFEAGGC